MKAVTVKLSDRLVAAVDQAAATANVSRAALIRSTLEESLAAVSSGSCFDLAGDLAESIRGLPADLATNRRYMEDFGR